MESVNEGLPDPLGARDTVVHVENLTRWNFTHLPLVQEDRTESDKPESERSPFVWRNDLNSKIILWLVGSLFFLSLKTQHFLYVKSMHGE